MNITNWTTIMRIDKQQVARFKKHYTKLTYKNNNGNLRERWAFLDTGGTSAFVVEGNTSGYFLIEKNIHPSSAVASVNQT